MDGEPAAAPLVPQVVDVAVGDRGETPEALVAADLVLAPEDFLGGGPPGELSVGFVNLGEQSDVGGRVAAPEGPCGGLCAAVADRPDAAVPGDEAGDLGPREAGRRFEEAFDGALVGLAEAGVEDPLQGVGDQGIRPVTVEGGAISASAAPSTKARISSETPSSTGSSTTPTASPSRARLREAAIRLNQGGAKLPSTTPDPSMSSTPSRITVQPGRLGSESVDGLARNRWTVSLGMGGRIRRNRQRDSVQAIARRHELHPNQVSAWKRQLLDAVPEVFAKGAGRKLAKEHEAKIRDLHAKIGELTVERDFFRRGLGR